MDEAGFEQKLSELVREFGEGADTQRKRLPEPPGRTHPTPKKLEKSISTLQESLDYLRVCIKYQVFDLEATRRENEYLRRLIEEQSDS
jgi:hypothetical protein